MAAPHPKSGPLAWIDRLRSRLRQYRLQRERQQALRDLLDRHDGHMLDDIGVANENRGKDDKPNGLPEQAQQRPWQL